MAWWSKRTSIIPPTALFLGDGVRVISRLLQAGEEGTPNRSRPTDWVSRSSELATAASGARLKELHRIARRKGEQAKEQSQRGLPKAHYDYPSKLLLRPHKSLKRCETHAVGEAEALLERFEHFVPLVERGIAQASRRVLYGEQLPAAEKLLSLFEEHTQIITRHKAGKPREFGRKVLIDEVDGGIISRYEVLSESGSERSRASRESEGPSAALRAGAFPVSWRPRSLFGRERESRLAGRCKAGGLAQERQALRETKTPRETTLVQARFPL